MATFWPTAETKYKVNSKLGEIFPANVVDKYMKSFYKSIGKPVTPLDKVQEHTSYKSNVKF